MALQEYLKISASEHSLDPDTNCVLHKHYQNIIYISEAIKGASTQIIPPCYCF